MTGYPSVDKPWLKLYSEEAINSILPKETLYDYLWNCNKNNLDDIALEYFGRMITYKELFLQINKVAGSFQKLGVTENDIVTLCSVTTPETIYCIYALAKIGAIANIVEPRTNAESIVKRINETGSKVTIILDLFFDKIKNFNICSETIVTVSVANSMSFLTRFGFLLTKGHKVPKVLYDDSVIKWNSFKSLYNAEDTIEGIEYKENKPVAIIYTSGTTGVPKGAQLTHDSINAVAFQYRYPFPYNRGDRFLDIMPPFIAYGLSCGIHMPLTLGLTLVIIPAFVPEEFPNYILKYKPNFFMGVPAHFEYIVTSEKMKDVDLSFVKVAAMGGDALNPDLELAIDKFLKDHNSSSKVYKGYGMTEMSAAAAATLSCITGEKFGSVGVPFQHNVVSVFEPGTDHELKFGEIGEFCICGPGMMYGYFNNDEETDKVLIKHSDGKIWAHTQDVGYIDEEGFIYFKDRIKRIFVRPDGHNVWPSVIESTVIKHDAVKDCAVVGLPNPTGRNGKIPAAFVTLKDGIEVDKAEIEKELREICLKEIPEREVALLYYFIDEIPHTPIGKVDYRALEDGDWEIGEYTL